MFKNDREEMMKVFVTIIQIVILFTFYQLGEWIKQIFHVSIPGSIIGMLLLFLLLMLKVFPVKWIDAGASLLLSYLPLLFLPITVGVMDYFSFFSGRGWFSLVVIFFSTILVFIISGYVSQWTAYIQNQLFAKAYKEKRKVRSKA